MFVYGIGYWFSTYSVSTIMEIILWDFLMLYQIFLSPQVKRSAIISNKQHVYELFHELPNDLNLKFC